MKSFILWLAQGFGSGRIPFAPGTFGSVVGLAYFAALLTFHSPIIFLLAIVLSIPFSAWVCGEGEKILGAKDPGSIVMDEIIAIPMCFAGWLMTLYFSPSGWPSPEYFFSAPHWPMTVAVFVLFRIFDVAKPWPVRQSQSLPGGWGVTIDDVLAAVYVNVVVLIIWKFQPSWF